MKHTGFINKNGLKNYTKVIGGGDQPDPIAAYKRMMRLGMLIDVAHMSQKSVNDLFDLVDPNRSDGEEDYPFTAHMVESNARTTGLSAN